MTNARRKLHSADFWFFVKSGYTYEDPGYTTIDSNLLVKTEGIVSNQVGMYQIKYVGVNSNGQNIEAKRFVIVTAKDFDSSPIILIYFFSAFV